MREIIIKVSALLLIFVILLLGATKVYADGENSVDLLITPSKTKLKAGEEVTIEVKATNINAGRGISGFALGEISFDSSVFNYRIDASNEKWDVPVQLIVDGEGSITAMRIDSEGIGSEDQVIFNLILTAKSDATIGQQTISFSEMIFAGEGDNISVPNQTVDIQIVEDEIDPAVPETVDPDPENPDDGSREPDSSEDETQDQEQTQEDEEENEEENVADDMTVTNSINGNKVEYTTVLPYAGIEKGVIVLIIIALIVAILTYRKYKYWKNF